jgi:hypothetical protein
VLRQPVRAMPDKYEIKFIVQDKESGCFLMPYNGDVGFTSWAHEAGRFDAVDEAEETALQHCSEGFYVTRVI